MSDNSVGSVSVHLDAETSDFHKAMEDAAESLKGFGALAESLGAEKVFEYLKASFEEFVDKASEAELTTRKLQSVLEGMGAGKYAEDFEAYAESLSKTSTFSKDATLDAAALAGKLGISADNIAALLPVMADYAAFTGKNIPEASEQMAQAVEYGGRTLKGLGLGFTASERAAFDAADQYERTQMLIEKVNGSMEGFSQTAAGTAAGAMKQLHNATDELEISFGKVIDAPIAALFHGLTSAVNEVRDVFDGLSPTLKNIVGDAAIGAGGLLGIGLAALSVVSAFKGFQALGIAESIGEIATATAGFGATLWAALAPLLPMVAVFVALTASAVGFYGALKNLRDGVKFDSIGDAFKGAFGRAIDDVKGMFDGLFDHAEERAKKLHPEDMASGSMDFGGKAVGVDGGEAGDAFDRISKKLEDAKKKTEEYAKASENLATVSAKLTDAVGNRLTNTLSGTTTSNPFQLSDRSGADLAAKKTGAFDTGTLSVGPSPDKEIGFSNDMSTSTADAPQRDETTQGMSHEEVNAVAATNKQNTDAQKQWVQVEQAATNLGKAALSALGSAGSAIQNIGTAFLTGGPVSGMMAIGAELISRNQAFQQVGQILEQVLVKMSTALTPIIQALEPLLQIFVSLGDVIVALGPIIKLLGDIIKGLGEILKGIMYGIEEVVKGIGWIWNQIIGILDDVLGWLGVDLSKYKLDLSSFDTAIKDLGKSVEVTDQRFQSMNENIPTGYKVAAAAYNAITVGRTGDGSGDSSSTTPAITNMLAGTTNVSAPSTTVGGLNGGLDGSYGAPAIGNVANAAAMAAATHFAGAGIASAPTTTINGGITVNANNTPDAIMAALKKVQAKQSFIMSGITGVGTRQFTAG